MSVNRSLKHNLSNLHRFGGRDPRPIFWPYAIAVYILTHVALTVVMIPWLTESFLRMQSFAAQHPEQAEVRVGPGHYSITIEDSGPGLTDLSSEMVGIAIVWIGAIALLAAAVARRLHDRDRSAVWGLMPIPFLTYYLIATPTSFADLEDPSSFPVHFLSGVLFFGALIVLAVFLAGPSSPAMGRDENEVSA